MTNDIVRLKNIGLKYFNNVPLIMYLTDDLVMEPECLGNMVSILERHPEFGVVSPSLSPPNPFVGQFICVGILWTKEAIDRVGVMDIEFSPRFEEEHDHMIRLVEGGFSPHRITNAIMAHKQINGGSMKTIAGKKFTEPRERHKLKISQRYEKSNNKLESTILNFPTMEAEKNIRHPKIAWMASNILGNIDGGCMIACINSIIGLNEMGIDVKPYKFPYESISRDSVFDNDVKKIKDLIDTNREEFDLVEKNKANVKCDILIEYHGPPQPMVDWDKHYNIMWTTWESTHMDTKKAKILCTADEVWVPSNFTREILMRNMGELGLSVPIYTMPLGFNPEMFTPDLPTHCIPLIPKRGFTFLYMGDIEKRKGFDLFVKAFSEEFKDEDIYALIHIKDWNETFVEKFNNLFPDRHPNIRIVKLVPRKAFSLERFQMPELYASADAFVMCSRGEAFALSSLESLACEVPVIYTDWGGHKDFLTPKIAYPVEYKLVKPIEYGLGKPILSELARHPKARYAEVLIPDLRKQMRYVYEHQDEAKQKAVMGRKVLLEKWTWNHACEKMKTRINEIWRKNYGV